jgi:hypothetical protein
MRVPFGRSFALVALWLAVVAVPPVRAAGQQPAPRSVTLATDPVILTRIETLLAMPDAVLTTDFYRIDTRFGPNVALDAVVVTAVDLQRRIPGLRIGLHDDAKPVARSSSSFLDIDEAASLSRALTSMIELAGKWTGREDQRSTDVSFTTVGGFAIGIHEAGRVQRGFLSSGVADPVRTSIEVADFVTLKLAVDQAIAVLAEK